MTSAAKDPPDPAGKPTVADADLGLAALMALTRREVDPALLAMIGTRVRSLLQIGPPPPEPASERDRVLAAFVDQFVIDVSGIDDTMRTATFGHLGADSLAVAQALYLVDLTERRAVALERLGLGDAAATAAQAGIEPALDPHAQLWPALEEHWRLVARLDQLDPLTTELVRLRGAAAHRCRLCQSRRNSEALQAAASETGSDPLATVLAPRPAGLDPTQAALIELVDAMVSQPTGIDARLIDALHREVTDDQLAETIHDVVRNAANKIAVAFGADAPQVSNGVELFTVDAAGDVQVLGTATS